MVIYSRVSIRLEPTALGQKVLDVLPLLSAYLTTHLSDDDRLALGLMFAVQVTTSPAVPAWALALKEKLGNQDQGFVQFVLEHFDEAPLAIQLQLQGFAVAKVLPQVPPPIPKLVPAPIAAHERLAALFAMVRAEKLSMVDVVPIANDLGGRTIVNEVILAGYLLEVFCAADCYTGAELRLALEKRLGDGLSKSYWNSVRLALESAMEASAVHLYTVSGEKRWTVYQRQLFLEIKMALALMIEHAQAVAKGSAQLKSKSLPNILREAKRLCEVYRNTSAPKPEPKPESESEVRSLNQALTSLGLLEVLSWVSSFGDRLPATLAEALGIKVEPEVPIPAPALALAETTAEAVEQFAVPVSESEAALTPQAPEVPEETEEDLVWSAFVQRLDELGITRGNAIMPLDYDRAAVVANPNRWAWNTELITLYAVLYAANHPGVALGVGSLEGLCEVIFEENARGGIAARAFDYLRGQQQIQFLTWSGTKRDPQIVVPKEQVVAALAYVATIPMPSESLRYLRAERPMRDTDLEKDQKPVLPPATTEEAYLVKFGKLIPIHPKLVPLIPQGSITRYVVTRMTPVFLFKYEIDDEYLKACVRYGILETVLLNPAGVDMAQMILELAVHPVGRRSQAISALVDDRNNADIRDAFLQKYLQGLMGELPVLAVRDGHLFATDFTAECLGALRFRLVQAMRQRNAPQRNHKHI